MNETKDGRGAEGPPAGDRTRNRAGARFSAPVTEAAAQARSVGRPSVVEPFRLQLGALLEAHPKMKTAEVLHRMRQAGYSGGKSVLYEMVRSLRNRDLPLLATFSEFPGILSRHDFGAVAIHYSTGRKERIRFFVSRLGFSRYLDVRLIGDHGIESLVRALLAGF